jgi:hypothetical protein
MALTTTKLADLLTRKGISATVQVYESASFDPATNLTTKGSVTNYSIKIIPPYKNIEGYKKTEMITSGKGLTGFANKDLSFTVKAGLLIIVLGKTWTVVSVTPISNNAGILFYLMEIETGS